MIFYIFMIILSPFTAVIPLLHAVYLLIKGRVNIENNYWNKGLFLMFSWALIVALLNISIMSFAGAFLLLGFWAITIVGQKHFNSRKKINAALKYIIYCTALAALNGIMEKITFMFMGRPEHRIFSTFGNPNMTGAWFASGIFIVLYSKNNKRTINENRIYNATLVLNSIALVLTESSGALVAFGVSMGAYLLIKKIKSFKSLLIIVVATISILGMFAILQKNSKSAGVIKEIAISINSRMDIWQGSLEMIAEKPLTGWGLLGTLEHGISYFPHNGNSIHSHNLWLSLLVSLGVVGLIGYLILKVRLAKDIFILYNRKEPLISLIIALNMMVIVQGLVDCSLYSPQLGIMFMVTNGVVINLVNGKITNKRNNKKRENVIHFEPKALIG